MAVNLFNQIYEIIWGISKEKDKMAADPGRIEAQMQLMVSDAALKPVNSQLEQAYPE